MMARLSRHRQLHAVSLTFMFAFSSTVSWATASVSPVKGELLDLDSYKIVWSGPWDAATQKVPDDDTVINISTNNNDRYRCLVPNRSDQLNFDTSAKNSSADEQTNSPVETLESLRRKNYCSYKFELFWVYELCHGKFLRQYHEETSKYKTKLTQEYFLGKIDPEQIKAHIKEYELEKSELDRNGLSRPTIMINGVYKPFVQFNMTDGTKCDLTKKNRMAKIIYVCNDEPRHELYSIKETSTCEYEAIVLSPLLCLHKDFKVDVNILHEIECYSLEGAPRRPANSIESDEDEELKRVHKGTGIHYLEGRAIIYEADHILAELS